MKHLTIMATCLALIVVLLGAYTRLKDAGLGCPDWPGCYGHWTVPAHPEQLHAAMQAYPDQPLIAHKAGAEMLHRYVASTLGVMVLVMSLLALRSKTKLSLPQRAMVATALLLVILQGGLGKYTVTFGLHPGIVMLHLLGGFSLVTLLCMLSYALYAGPQTLIRPKHLPITGILCMGLLLLQIGLGGWTSANYAARSCPTLPTCTGNWLAIADFGKAFSIPPLSRFSEGAGSSYEYAPHLDVAAKITIQMTHRLGAVLTLLVLGGFLLRVMLAHRKTFELRHLAVIGTSLLTLQFCLGVLNVLLDLPLALAVLHNGVAALLLATLGILNYMLYQHSGNCHEQNPRSSFPKHATPLA